LNPYEPKEESHTLQPLTMQAIKLAKKYPTLQQDEVMSLVNQFK
jgi:hypothetical protein